MWKLPTKSNRRRSVLQCVQSRQKGIWCSSFEFLLYSKVMASPNAYSYPRLLKYPLLKQTLPSPPFHSPSSVSLEPNCLREKEQREKEERELKFSRGDAPSQPQSRSKSCSPLLCCDVNRFKGKYPQASNREAPGAPNRGGSEPLSSPPGWGLHTQVPWQSRTSPLREAESQQHRKWIERWIAPCMCMFICVSLSERENVMV